MDGGSSKTDVTRDFEVCFLTQIVPKVDSTKNETFRDYDGGVWDPNGLLQSRK